jgi:hypothetical protein
VSGYDRLTPSLKEGHPPVGTEKEGNPPAGTEKEGNPPGWYENWAKAALARAASIAGAEGDHIVTGSVAYIAYIHLLMEQGGL